MKLIQESPDICSQQSNLTIRQFVQHQYAADKHKSQEIRKKQNKKKNKKTKTSKTNNFLFFVSDTSSSLQINDAG